MDSNNSNFSNRVIKCRQHTNQSIILLCVSCSTPICTDCIDSGYHLNHPSGNKINYFTQFNIYPILEQFKKRCFIFLNGYKKSNQLISQSSEKCRIKSIEKMNKEKEKIKSKFQSLHFKLDLIKKDSIKQCDFNFINLKIQKFQSKIYNTLKNICFFKSIPLTDEYNRLMINKLLKHDNELLYYSNGEPIPLEYKKVKLEKNINYDTLFINGHVEVLHISSHFREKLNQFKNLKKIIIHKNRGFLSKYSSLRDNDGTEVYICYNDSKNNKCYYIKQHISNKRLIFTINKENVSLVTRGDIVTENSIAIGDLGDKCSIFLFVNLEYQELYFLNGFNKKIGKFLRNNYLKIHLYNIFKPLDIHSFSKIISCLYFHDEFNQPLFKGILPNNVKELHFYNIGPNVLHSGSIPLTINKLYFHDGFNQKLNRDIVPDGIKELHLYNIGPNVLQEGTISSVKELHLYFIGSNVLQFESIPNDIERLYLHNGFNPELIKGMVPEGVKSLYLYNIGPNVLQVGSIPIALKFLYLEDGFNQPLVEGIIPDDVENIYFYNIGSNVLQFGSIPCFVKRLYFHLKFNQPLYKGIIPEGVESIHLFNIGPKVLQFESIPFTVKWLHLEDGFNQPLIDSVIPGSVISLVLNNIGEKVLQDRSIPNTVKSLYLNNGFNQPLVKGIIPEGVESLYIYNIGPKVLQVGSIPNTVKLVYLADGFNQPLYKGMIPDGVQDLYINDIGLISLKKESIPSFVKRIYFKLQHKFLHTYYEGMVPASVKVIWA